MTKVTTMTTRTAPPFPVLQPEDDPVKYFLKKNIYHQDKALHHLTWITENIRIMNPTWTPSFVVNYLKSRYPDNWYYYHDLKERYYALSRPSRDMYRVKLVTQDLCTDVVGYIESFLVPSFDLR